MLLIFVLLCSASLLGCEGEDASTPERVQRESQPDYVRTDDNPELDRAMVKGRETYLELVDALAKPEAGESGHALKKAFAAPEGGKEYMWINELTWDGERFHGVINNEPVDTEEVKLGDKVTVTPAEVADWMYVKDGSIVGGYTVRVLHHQSTPEEQKAFTQATGLTVPPVDF